MRHSRNVVVLSAATLIALVACGEPAQPSALRAAPAKVAPPTHSPYRLTDLGNIGGNTAFAWRINERGQAIGWGTTASGLTHGFFWTAKTGMIDLGTFPGAVGSVAWGLNDDGIVVGEIDLPSGHVRAFRWTASGGMRDLGTLGGDDALAQGVNNRGEVVGYSTLAGGGPTHGFVWTARDGMKDAAALINQFPVTSFTNHDVTLDDVPAFSWSGVTNNLEVLSHTFGTMQTAQRVRITTTASSSWVAWFEIRVLGC